MSMMQPLLVVSGLIAIAVMCYLAFNGPSPTRESARRLQGVRDRHAESTQDRVEAQLRKAVAARKPKMHQIAGSDSRIAALSLRLHRSGKKWTVAQYFYLSLGLTLGIGVLLFLKTGAFFLALGVGVLIGAGVPHLVLNYLIGKRSNQFTTRFPDAIDLLVRGLRSGLPVTETLSIVGTEVPGPVGEEFRAVVDRIRVGRTMEDALQETADRLNTPEFSFFCIALAIQRETGGNLAETLSNLADVLRKRGQMKLKIKAMSSESKASAYIVGSLPFIVFGLVWWIKPDYIGEFFVDERLIVAGLGGLTWMGIGIFIMAKMVNFEI